MSFLNLFTLIEHFKDEQACYTQLESMIWPDGDPKCPHCASTHIYRLNTPRQPYKCGDCKKKFSALVGTIFEHTKVPLKKWFIAIYLCTSRKKGCSSLQLSRDISVTQKTAWHMLHRIREMFKHYEPESLLEGEVQLDEAYIGGKSKNKHKDRRVKNTQGRNLKDKIAVFGMREKGGNVRTEVVPNVKQGTLVPKIYDNIETGSVIMTDDWFGYGDLSRYYDHLICNHSGYQYVNPENGATTNGMENYWSHLKRSITGCYHSVSRKHVDRYLREWEYRFNTRKFTDSDRFILTLSNAFIPSLRYRQLIT